MRLWTKVKIALLSILVVVGGPTAYWYWGDHNGLLTYSEGLRFGRIDKCAAKGGYRQLWLDSFECQLNMGKDGDVWVEVVKGPNGEQMQVTRNPWAFSGSVNDQSKFQNVSGYVWIEYNQSMFKGGRRATDYNVLQVGMVSKQHPVIDACTRIAAINDKEVSGQFSKGWREGYLIKSSVKGNILKTWEATLQVGDSGRNFIDMSITSEDVKDCADAYIKAGMPVTVYYTENGVNLRPEDTTYTIYKIVPRKAN